MSSQTAYYLGKHEWKGGFLNETCYNSNITSIRTFNLTGELISSLVSPDGSSNYTQNDGVTLQANLVDDCGNNRKADSTFILTMSNGASQYSCTADVTGSCTINTNISYPSGWYNISTFANKTYHWNASTLNETVFYLNAYRDVFNESVEPISQYYTYNNWNLSVAATSGDTTPMNITLYLRKPGTSTFKKYTEYTTPNKN